MLQIAALLAGISRDGITMVGGLWRGLDREDAARFAFLLATPPILAAGVLKLPDLAGHAGAHIHGQIVVGFLITGITAYLSVRFLVRYFRTRRSLTPFAIYCLVAGLREHPPLRALSGSIEVPGHDIAGLRADNPGPFTLAGTNSWLIAREPTWLIDPGPSLPEHIDALARGDRATRRAGRDRPHPRSSRPQRRAAGDPGTPPRGTRWGRARSH